MDHSQAEVNNISNGVEKSCSSDTGMIGSSSSVCFYACLVLIHFVSVIHIICNYLLCKVESNNYDLPWCGIICGSFNTFCHIFDGLCEDQSQLQYGWEFFLLWQDSGVGVIEPAAVFPADIPQMRTSAIDRYWSTSCLVSKWRRCDVFARG